MFNRNLLLLGVMAVLFLGAPLTWAGGYRSDCDDSKLKSRISKIQERGLMADPRTINYLHGRLVFGSKRGCANAVRLLLRTGVNPNVPDGDEFALLEAVDRLKFYFRKRQETGCKEFWGRFTGKLAVVRALLQAGANPNQVGRNGQTALHIAAENRFWDAVHLLLKAGADPDSMNDRGETAREKIRPNSSLYYLKNLHRSGDPDNNCRKG